MHARPLGTLCALLLACGSAPAHTGSSAPRHAAPWPPAHARPEEPHLGDLRPLTAHGENAEAYWSFGGQQLILQSRTGQGDCDRIYRMPLGAYLEPGAAPSGLPQLIPVSSGKGTTTCSYFLPGDKQVIF